MKQHLKIVLAIAVVMLIFILCAEARSNSRRASGHKQKSKAHGDRKTAHNGMQRSSRRRNSLRHSKRHRPSISSTTAASTLAELDEKDFTTLQDEASGHTLDFRTVPDCESCVVVPTESGKVRGRVVEVMLGKRVSTFLGIPYGEPPVGQKRFKAPTPVKSWEGTRDAFEYPFSCYQWADFSFESYKKGFRGTAMWNTNTPKNEDCLYLNVWTPELVGDNSSLAVMVWVYGGGYYSGTSSLDVYDGKWLAVTQQVVVVSMNYRVAALGFLAADHPEIPGNAGMLDQVLALEWVRDNIRSFGGDPKKVTLFGESAGAASVSLHMISPLSRGLFSNAILQSATAFSPWTLIPLEEAHRRTLAIADTINCTEIKRVGDKGSIERSINVSCLQTTDPQILVDVEMGLEDWGTAKFPNAPIVDGHFLKNDPSHLLDDTENELPTVNVLAGFNLNEGTYFLVYGSPAFNLKNESKINRSQFKAGLRRALRSVTDLKSDEAVKVLTDATEFAYTNGIKPRNRTLAMRPIDKDWVKIPVFPLQNSPPPDVFYRNLLDDMVGDVNFVCPVIDFLDEMLQLELLTKVAGKRSKVYLYNFVHRSSQNPWPEWMGVMHGYEVEFNFGIPLDRRLNYTKLEKELSLLMMTRWANFAKYGNPNGPPDSTFESWPTYQSSTKYINLIGYRGGAELENISTLFSPVFAHYKSHCAFWKEFFPQMESNVGSVLSDCPKSFGSKTTEYHFNLLMALTIITSYLLMRKQ